VETSAKNENFVFQYACCSGAFKIIQNNGGLCICEVKDYKMDTGNSQCSGNIKIIPISDIYEVSVNTLLNLRTKSLNHQTLQSRMLRLKEMYLSLVK
jgi:hypothetical protein